MSGSVVSTYEIERRRREEMERRIRQEIERLAKEREEAIRREAERMAKERARLLQVKQELQKEKELLERLEEDCTFYGFPVAENMGEYKAKLAAFNDKHQQVFQLAKNEEAERRAAFYAEAEALKKSIPLRQLQSDFAQQEQKRREMMLAAALEKHRQVTAEPQANQAIAAYENCRKHLETMRQEIQNVGECPELDGAFQRLEEIRQRYSQRPQSQENEIDAFWNLHAGDLYKAVKAVKKKKKEKEEEQQKYQKYLTRYADYAALCDICGDKPQLPPMQEEYRSTEDNAKLEKAIEKLQATALHRLSRKEMMGKITRAMNRMGYSLLGTQGEESKQFQALYTISDNTVIHVTHDESGQIIMDVGIPGNTGEKPTDRKRKRAAKEAETFCQKREKMKAVLAEEGLVLQDKSVAPPVEAVITCWDTSGYKPIPKSIPKPIRKELHED